MRSQTTHTRHQHSKVGRLLLKGVTTLVVCMVLVPVFAFPCLQHETSAQLCLAALLAACAVWPDVEWLGQQPGDWPGRPVLCQY